MMDMATTTLPSPIQQTRGHRFPSLATIARDALYLIAGLPAGIVTFTVLVTGLSLAAGLAITLAGIPVLVFSLYLARWMGDAERARARLVDPTPITRSGAPWTGGLWSRTKAATTDLGAWRDTLWGLLLLPIGIAGFTIAITFWSAALGFLTSPLWWWSLPDNSDQPTATLEFLNSRSVEANAARFALGVVLVPVAVYVCRATALATAKMARAVLAH